MDMRVWVTPFTIPLKKGFLSCLGQVPIPSIRVSATKQKSRAMVMDFMDGRLASPKVG